MLRQIAAGIACGVLGAMACAAEPENSGELETVVVTGEQPGPGLWKVSKGDHVMWVLASHAPLPKGMTWRTRQIEDRIAESQEVLYAPQVIVRPNIGMVRGISLKSAASKASRLPEGRTLADVLSAPAYSRWSALREKYLGKGDYVEKLRPGSAMRLLRMHAQRRHGLQGGPNVLAAVDRERRKHKVRAVRLPAVVRTVELEDPRGLLESLQEVQPSEVECFLRNLDRVEPEVERMKSLANAWSLGDVDKLRNTFRRVTLRDAIQEGCVHLSLGGAVMSARYAQGSAMEAGLTKKPVEDSLWHGEQAAMQAQLDWLKAAQAALARNKSTFAVLGLGDVLGSEGHLEKLRALDYGVEEPR